MEIFVECKSEAIKLVKSQEHICEYMNRNFGVFVRFFSNFDGSYKVNIRGQLTNMESLNNAITYISLITGTQMVKHDKMNRNTLLHYRSEKKLKV